MCVGLGTLCFLVSQGLSVGLDNSIEFLVINITNQLLQGQLQKQQGVDTNNYTYFTEKRILQRKGNIKARASRPLSEIAQWKIYHFFVTQQRHTYEGN
jgi:hypothetical protein